MLLIKQIKYNDDVKIGVIDIKEVDTKKEAHHIVQSFIANFLAHRKDLQDVLQYSMSRRMPKIYQMLRLLLKMIKITRIQLDVLQKWLGWISSMLLLLWVIIMKNEDSVSRVNKNKNVKKTKAVTTNKIFNDVTKTKWPEATDSCQISDVKRGYSINEDFQNL